MNTPHFNTYFTIHLLSFWYIQTKLLDVFEDDEHIVLVLELATRGDMLEFINKRGHLSEAQARGFVTQIAAALAYCHRKRVVHRSAMFFF